MSKKMTPTQCAYLAGVIDSDGCISISRSFTRTNSYSIIIRIAISKIEILEWIVDKTELGSIKKCKMTRPGEKWDRSNIKQLYYWGIYSNNIRIVLPQIVKYLVGKKEQGEIMLKWLGNKSPRGRSVTKDIDEWRVKNWKRMKVLNQRGVRTNESRHPH